jgi:flagellar motility protein MotE (MotC chaperone)
MQQHPYDMPPRLRPRQTREQAGPITGRFGATPSLRLLPVLILAAVGMLGFKLQVIVKEVAGETRLVAFVMEQSAAFAQAAAPNAAKPAAPAAVPAATPAAAAAGTAAAPGAGGAAAPAAEGAAPGEAAAADAAGGPPSMLNFDPATLTKSEIDTLQRLAERREFIERRERETNAKEGLLKAAEARIDGKIVQLQDLEKNIQSLLKQYDAQKQEEINQLVTIYSAMKPKDAARIFDTLEMPTLVGVIQKMKETKVAPILAAMDARRAVALTEELTARRQLSSDPAPMTPTPAAARAPAPGAAPPRAN